MPQMSPIMWMSLYMYISILLATSCILHYFVALYTPKISSTIKSNIMFNWKW